MEMEHPSLRLEKASLSFQNTVVLDDITLKLNPGESLAIIGASGSGKTSLANLICKTVHPSSGEVENSFRTVFASQQDHFSEIAGLGSTYYSKRYEFHDYENPMTVPTYFSQLFKRLGMEDQKLEDLELLDTFKIRYLLGRNLLQLSNGERKRLQLIAAILEDPQLLIMDQPFTGLDVKSRAQL
jgi:molybdate transport system ATP-binding protein